jgi:hypothetical protein
MLFVIGLLALVAVVGFALTLRAVARLREHVTERFVATAELEAGLHGITRKYVGHELIEKRVLPTIGYREPEKTPVEKWMLETWKREASIDCGEMDAPEIISETSETN